MVIFISEIVFKKERKSLQNGPRGAIFGSSGALWALSGPKWAPGGSRMAFRGAREGSEAKKTSLRGPRGRKKVVQEGA